MNQHCFQLSDEKEIIVQISALSVQRQGRLSPDSSMLGYIPSWKAISESWQHNKNFILLVLL